jgi:hypothetical protein
MVPEPYRPTIGRSSPKCAWALPPSRAKKIGRCPFRPSNDSHRTAWDRGGNSARSSRVPEPCAPVLLLVRVEGRGAANLRDAFTLLCFAGKITPALHRYPDPSPGRFGFHRNSNSTTALPRRAGTKHCSRSFSLRCSTSVNHAGGTASVCADALAGVPAGAKTAETAYSFKPALTTDAKPGRGRPFSQQIKHFSSISFCLTLRYDQIGVR